MVVVRLKTRFRRTKGFKMVKVAQYEPNQIQSSVIRQPKSSGGSLNLQPLAKGISDIGNAFSNVKDRVDITSAEEALNRFEKAKNNVLFNPDNGYYNTQGRDAYDNATEAQQSLEKLKNEFGDGLNAQSRQMFNSVADKHLIRSNVDISKHSAQGLRVWEITTIESQVENTMENAALYWNNPKDLKVQRIIGEEAILDSAELTGIGPEATAEKLQTYRSKFMVSAIDAATVQSSAEGQKLLDENKDMLEGPDKVNLQKDIDTKKKAEETQFNAGQATLTATRLVNDYDTRREIQEEVNKIKDPELRKKTMTESMALYSRERQIEQEERGDAFENAEQTISQGGTATSFQATNPEEWNKLSPAQQKKLSKDEPIETNWNTYSGLLTMPKDALAKINPVDYFDQLADTERKTLISSVKTAKGGAGKTEKTDSQVGRTRAAETKSAVVQIFGPVKKHKGDKLEKINSFYSLLDSEVKYREDEKGSNLTSAEFTDTLAGFTRTVVQEGYFWDTEINFDDIPTEDISELSNILRTSGVPVTNESLVQLSGGLSSANIPPADALQVGKFLKTNNIPVTAENIAKAYGQAIPVKVKETDVLHPIPER